MTACADGSGADDDASSTTANALTTQTTEPTTTTAALEGEPLVVSEQGLSTFPDLVDPQSELGGYGVILENPNTDLMATGVRVVTRILDPKGAERYREVQEVVAELDFARTEAARRYLDGKLDLEGGHPVRIARRRQRQPIRLGLVAPRHGVLRGKRHEEEDEREGAPAVVVIGENVWRNRFAGDPAILERTIQL